MLKKRRFRVAAASLALLVGLAIVGQGWPSEPSPVHHSLARGVLTPRQFQDADYLLYVPTSAREDRPITVLVGLRGIADDPEQFASNLAPEAERNGWLLVVPRYSYGDWQQVAALRSDAQKHLPWLRSLLDALPEETFLRPRERVLLYGFSRGAQSAHRFALAYPERVLGVAALAAGTYTLPIDHSAAYDDHAPLRFPIGVSDIDRYCGRPFDPEALRQVAFWVGVGELDNAPGDVPRTWDRYLGLSRVDRARAFALTLSELGVRTELAMIPRTGHQETAEGRATALGFLKGLETQATAAPDG